MQGDELRQWVLGLSALVLSACGGSSPSAGTGQLPVPDTGEIPPAAGNLSVPDRRQARPIRVLLIGNSHASGVAPQLSRLLQLGLPGTDNELSFIGFVFLDSAAASSSALQQIDQGGWTHLILQGQKYSQSGTVDYPTGETELLLHRGKAANSQTILFPEHPQYGDTAEGQRVYQLHLGIARQQSSCVAPVGPVWDLALLQPGVPRLHSNDGNHANALGSLLSAYVLYQVITGQSAELLPEQSSLPGSTAEQAKLQQITAQLLSSKQSCPFE
ncbi:hypothetical protein [Rheinheimera sp.]|uniref:hypothetical protein n=1 Tax=Rheinheimera sp. TaxID=1869214 RepID=UPI00307DD009